MFPAGRIPTLFQEKELADPRVASAHAFYVIESALVLNIPFRAALTSVLPIHGHYAPQ